MVFRIGKRVYQTKGRAKEAIREVLYRFQPGQRVTAPKDHKFLTDLLRLHSEAEHKIGVGIAWFEVRQNGGTQGFWVVRTDGSETDFSYLECLRPSSHEQKVRDAMRQAISDQRDQFREEAFAAGDVICPITGDQLTEETCDVDHAEPAFEELANEFVSSQGGYDAVNAVSRDGLIGSRLTDPEFERKWKVFHRKRATLRVVSREANRGLLRRGKRRQAA